MADYKAYMRRKLLEDIYDRMSDEDKRLFVQMTLQDKSAEQIMSKLNAIDGKLENGGKAFAKDFAANVLGNYFADATIYLGSLIFKRFR